MQKIATDGEQKSVIAQGGLTFYGLKRSRRHGASSQVSDRP